MLQVLLADPRVNVNLCGSDGCTPLWFACYSRQRAVVQRMMLSGREIDWDKKGVHWDISYSPHDISLLEKDPETAVLLFQFKENPGKTRHQVGVDLLEPECLAAELFALVVFLADDFVHLVPETQQQQQEQSKKRRCLQRFFSLAMRLPMELQMVLCSRACGSVRGNITTRQLEPALVRVAALLS